ncbi:transmembrane protein [Perkinsela sp. CCAP 1560/4]|nr:transmembrane protein [Perkinsela sp. CCAP 1560/4]|eukprot:KNH04508.1 transmembrane protein [Perkinsela sp. CCAP 1560/4]
MSRNEPHMKASTASAGREPAQPDTGVPSTALHEQHLELPPTAEQMTLRFIQTAIKHRRVYFWLGLTLCLVAPTILALILMNHSVTMHHMESVPLVLGGYCALSATLLSLFQIMEHLLAFSQPAMQCKIIRILLMVPVYAVMSWMSCIFRTAAPYFALVRDIYESYALYNFLLLMIALLGGRKKLGQTLERRSEPASVDHLYPMNRYLRPIRANASFVTHCHRCVLQFMVLKPLCAFLVIVLVVHAKCRGETYAFSFRTRSYLCIKLVENVSVSVAFTALVYFYRATKNLLKGHSPLGKFLCIKLVLFASFWQGLFIELLHVCNLLPESAYWTRKEVANGLQDFCICVEMLLVAYGHKFCFGSQNYASRFGALREESQRSPPDERLCSSVPFFGASQRLVGADGGMALGVSPFDNLRYTLLHRDLFPHTPSEISH